MLTIDRFTSENFPLLLGNQELPSWAQGVYGAWPASSMQLGDQNLMNRIEDPPLKSITAVIRSCIPSDLPDET